MKSLVLLLAFCASCSSHRERPVEPDHGAVLDCRTSPDCKKFGMCATVKGGCMVGTAADCASSDGCKQFGACTPIQTESVVQPLVCRAAGDDCAKADACIQGRKCFAIGGVCTTEEQAPEACRVSPGCRNNGECSFQGGTCIATDEDCEREHACPNSYTCVAVNGHCTTPGAK